MENFFTGKRILVIGASGVLGAEFVRQLQSSGAEVQLMARTPLRMPTEFADVPSAHVDIRSRLSLDSAFSELNTNFDGVINAAGVVAFGSLGEVPEEIVAELFSTNALGVLNILSVAPFYLNPESFITSLTGVAADVSVLGMSAYCSSKAAAHSAMVIGARELRSKKIAVLDARPPHTETGLVTRALFGNAPKMPQGLEPSTVVRRVLDALAAGEKDLPADAFSS